MKSGRLSQKKGAMGEDYARIYLSSIRAKCVEKISTPMINIGGKAIYCKTSSVDFTAAIPSPGKIRPYESVRIEVKVCDKDRLTHSRLSEHQVKWLKDWHDCGFMSFVFWIYKNEIIVLEYPNEHFKHGKSISLEKAKEVQIKL